MARSELQKRKSKSMELRCGHVPRMAFASGLLEVQGHKAEKDGCHHDCPTDERQRALTAILTCAGGLPRAAEAQDGEGKAPPVAPRRCARHAAPCPADGIHAHRARCTPGLPKTKQTLKGGGSRVQRLFSTRPQSHRRFHRNWVCPIMNGRGCAGLVRLATPSPHSPKQRCCAFQVGRQHSSACGGCTET